MPRLTLIMILLAVVLSGCQNRRYLYQTDERHPPLAPDANVRLYVNVLRQPYEEIALVQSFRDTDTGAETRRRQLAYMTETARSIGADTIMDIKQMRGEVRGLVRDEMVPFPAVRQGEYETFFLRGVAVRLIPEEELDVEEEPYDRPLLLPLVRTPEGEPSPAVELDPQDRPIDPDTAEDLDAIPEADEPEPDEEEDPLPPPPDRPEPLLSIP